MASWGSNESPQGDNTSAHSHVSYDNRTLMFCISSIVTKLADAHPITIKKLTQNTCMYVHLGSRTLHRNTPLGLLECDHIGTYIYMHIYRCAYHWTNVWILYHPWLPWGWLREAGRQRDYMCTQKEVKAKHNFDNDFLWHHGVLISPVSSLEFRVRILFQISNASSSHFHWCRYIPSCRIARAVPMEGICWVTSRLLMVKMVLTLLLECWTAVSKSPTLF